MQRIEPGATIGIIGGGQLGRMSAQAAENLGYRVHVFTPETDSPTEQVCGEATIAEYTDLDALRRFAESVDVITFEFENIPHESVEALEAIRPVRPGWEVLKTCRNRLREKAFINNAGPKTTHFRAVRSAGGLIRAVEELGLPAILKTTELGYDGKGQKQIDPYHDLEELWQAFNAEEAILEDMVHFEKELSVIIARGIDGHTAIYDPVENIHKNHILDTTIAPADITPSLKQEAKAIAQQLADGLHLVGILAVELFLTNDERLLVNELAPRPHNSGHHTIESCATSQFEQFIRAVCGLPLGPTEMTVSHAEMKNILGEEILQWREKAPAPHQHFHDYGKKAPRPGRKMGHVTTITS